MCVDMYICMCTYAHFSSKVLDFHCLTLTVYGLGTPCVPSRSSRRTPSASLFLFEKSDNRDASGCFEASASPADQITAHFHLRLGSAM